MKKKKHIEKQTGGKRPQSGGEISSEWAKCPGGKMTRGRNVQ